MRGTPGHQQRISVRRLSHPTLWSKMQQIGISGKAFVWLRMLHHRMSYVVALQRCVRLSAKISCLWMVLERGCNLGVAHLITLVLISDPASPALWKLRLTDFGLDAHAESDLH